MNAAQLVAWLRALAWLAIAGVVLFVLTQIHYTLVTFSIAAVMSYVLYPVVNWLFTQSTSMFGRQLSWATCVIIVYITLPAIVGVGMYLSAPAITSQVETITQNLPQQLEKLQHVVDYWQKRFYRAHLPPAMRDQLQNLVAQAVNRFADLLTNFVGHVANGVINTVAWVLFLLIALIISQFMLLNLEDMRRHLYEAVPDKFRDEVRQVTHEVNVVFGGFVKGTVILSFIAAVTVFALLHGLSLLAWLGVPGFVPFEYCLLLALLTLFCYPIPIIGLVGVTLIGALTAYFQDGSTVAYIVTVTLILGGTFMSVDRFVGPRVMSKAMGVSPLFVMFSVIAGAELMGFWGMVLGVPMAAAVKVLFRYVRSRFLIPQDGDLNVASMMAGIPPAPAQAPAQPPKNDTVTAEVATNRAVPEPNPQPGAPSEISPVTPT